MNTARNGLPEWKLGMNEDNFILSYSTRVGENIGRYISDQRAYELSRKVNPRTEQYYERKEISLKEVATAVFEIFKKNLLVADDNGQFINGVSQDLEEKVYPLLRLFLNEVGEDLGPFLDTIFAFGKIPTPGTKSSEEPLTHRHGLDRMYLAYSQRMGSVTQTQSRTTHAAAVLVS